MMNLIQILFAGWRKDFLKKKTSPQLALKIENYELWLKTYPFSKPPKSLEPHDIMER